MVMGEEEVVQRSPIPTHMVMGEEEEVVHCAPIPSRMVMGEEEVVHCAPIPSHMVPGVLACTIHGTFEVVTEVWQV